MNKNNVVELSGRVEAGDALTAMLRTRAQELIRQAVDAELQELLACDGGGSTWYATAICQSDNCKRVLAQ